VAFWPAWPANILPLQALSCSAVVRTGSGNGWPVCISERARSPFNLAKEILKTALPNLAPV
jgi:hypothetical protein